MPSAKKRSHPQLYTRKVLPISIGGLTFEIDIADVQPVIEHRYFQDLAYRKQLANAEQIFRSATHTRFPHSVDTMRRQRERNELWLKYGMITAQQAKDLEIFALLHDIGHGPFSHVLDRICSITHDENGAQKIEEMRGAIEACGASYEGVRTLFMEKDPLYKAVMHHPLGTDKLSYLFLDAVNCITGRPDIGKLPQYIFWLNKELVVHIKCAIEAMELKRFYIKMYREVYLRKSCLIAQRLLEKIIYQMINSGELTEAALWDMSDTELLAPIVKTPAYRRYKYRESKTVIAFRVNGFEFVENVTEKPLSVYEKDVDWFDTVIRHSSIRELNATEEELAKNLKVSPNDMDIVPPMAAYRFMPPPISIKNGTRTFKDTEKFPQNQAAIAELASASMVMRVCVSRELRDRIHRKAGLIDEFFDNWVRKTRNIK